MESIYILEDDQRMKTRGPKSNDNSRFLSIEPCPDLKNRRSVAVRHLRAVQSLFPISLFQEAKNKTQTLHAGREKRVLARQSSSPREQFIERKNTYKRARESYVNQNTRNSVIITCNDYLKMNRWKRQGVSLHT